MKIDTLKKFPPLRWAMRFPGVAATYHFLFSFWAAKKYKHPSKKIFVIGITGTKGKTTVVELLNAILEAAHKKTALLSSLRVKIGDEIEKNTSNNTMPGRFFVQNFIDRAQRAGCAYAVIEVTSQGVVQSRHRFIDWNIGAITNLAPEHIEAHGSFEAYRRSKLSFLRYVQAHGGAVFLNSDDEASWGFFERNLGEKNIHEYGKDDDDVRRAVPSQNPMHSFSKRLTYRVFYNDFNLENIALAVAIARKIGIDAGTIRTALENFKGVQGRMDVALEMPFLAIVDYAHTPDSLRAVYAAIHALKKEMPDYRRKVICVLGAAGGGRDKWKRPEMGKIAAEYCSEIILTNEDPYDEEPEEIIAEVRSGILKTKFPSGSIHVVPDRREAIEKAVSLAGGGDVVIITGKGSEPWIHLGGGRRVPWSDRDVLVHAVEKMKKAMQ